MASLSFHGWYIGLKDKIDGAYKPSTSLASNYHMARGSDFEGEPEFETSDFEANCGEATTLLGSDRTSASSNPTWEQKAIFGEFFEEAWYMLLGGEPTITPIEEDGADAPVGYHWVIEKGATALPLATIKNSYFYDGGSTVIYNNAKMSNLQMEFDDEGINMTYEFASDVASPNNPNPLSKDIPSTLSKLGTNNFKVYIGDYGSGIYDIEEEVISEDASAYDCVTEGSLEFDNNLDDFICLGTPFGQSFKDEGDFTGEHELEIKWTGNNQGIIGKWVTGTANGTQATEQSYYAEVLLVGQGKKLGTVDNVDVYEKFLLYMPKVEITKAWSDLSGNETKTISIEFKIVSSGQSPVHIEIDTTYEKLSNAPTVSS